RWLAVFCRLFWVGLGAFLMLCAAIYVIEHSEREQACLMIIDPIHSEPSLNLRYQIKVTANYPAKYGLREEGYVLWDGDQSGIEGTHQYLKCPDAAEGLAADFTVTQNIPEIGKSYSIKFGDSSTTPEIYYVIFTNEGIFFIAGEWSPIFPSYLNFLEDTIFGFIKAIERTVT
ncbi:MAG: hypothetical protein HOI19_11500, partial [Rhodospirillaceae bacterium]|nr:hypothetical protein [Rhodospirillaceae bacterium]